MSRFFLPHIRNVCLGLFSLAFLAPAALAQSTVSVIGPVTPGDCVVFNSTTVIKDSGGTGCTGSGAGIPGGTNGQIQYNNSGNFGGFTANGDATINTATGSVTVSANAVTNSKLAQMPANTVKCNPTGSTGNAQDCTGFPTGLANPSALIGLTANSGVAITAMRSDATPALSQAIAPTWTALHTWTGVTDASRSTILGSNSAYTADFTRFGNMQFGFNCGRSSNCIVAAVNNDAVANTSTFPVPVTGSGVMQNNGNTVWGGYFECHQFGTGLCNGVEIDNFNYQGAPSSTLPPSRAIGAPTTPVGLSLVAANTAGIGTPTYFNGAIALQVPLQGAGTTHWLTGAYMDPGAVSNTGVYVDASNTLGATTAGRFDIVGTGSDTGLFVGVHGSTGTTNAIQTVFGGSQRFVVNSNGDITVSGGARTTYTPTLSCASGTLTTASATGRSRNIGKETYIEAVISVTTNGTCGGNIDFTLPTTAAAAYTLVGRDTIGTGKTYSCSIAAAATTAICQLYDNTFPGTSGAVIVVSGNYESQ